MTEAEFQNAVVDLAHVYGWKISHFGAARTKDGWSTPVRYDGKGFPDCVFVYTGNRPLPHRVLFVEFKTDRGRLSPAQTDWGDWLDDAGTEYCLWRPGNADIIAGVLSDGRVTKWKI